MTEIYNKPDIIFAIEKEGIELKQKGRRFWALCPLHSEKTPSFMVDPEKQTFHCFGCQKGGDVITFIQELKGFSFPDALKYLKIENGKPPAVNNGELKKRELIRAFNQWCKEYHNYLTGEYRCFYGMKKYIKTERDLEEYAPIFPVLSSIEHQLDVLVFGYDEDKFLLFKECR